MIFPRLRRHPGLDAQEGRNDLRHQLFGGIGRRPVAAGPRSGSDPSGPDPVGSCARSSGSAHAAPWRSSPRCCGTAPAAAAGCGLHQAGSRPDPRHGRSPPQWRPGSARHSPAAPPVPAARAALGRISLHLRRIENSAGLGQQVGAAVGGLCRCPFELATDRPPCSSVSASTLQLLVEDHRRSLLTPAHLRADLLPLLEARPAPVLFAGDLGGGPEHQHVHAPVLPPGGGIHRLQRVLPGVIQGFCQPAALDVSICSMIQAVIRSSISACSLTPRPFFLPHVPVVPRNLPDFLRRLKAVRGRAGIVLKRPPPQEAGAIAPTPQLG